jgi:tetratricopeptide (TPR) repeat protein
VILQKDPSAEGAVEVLIALDLSKKSLEAFEAEKKSAIDLVRTLEGENISLYGYDERLYRIAPFTTDSEMAVELIAGLSPEVMQNSVSDLKKVYALQQGNVVSVIIGNPNPEDNTELSSLKERIEKLKASQALYLHIPLFYYPLGSAMLLIWMALSSMSKRRSVPLAAVLALLCAGYAPGFAGILDFQELHQGNRAYAEGEYLQSIEHFKRYQQSHDSPEIRYNLGNAYYKVKEYEKASYWYERVYTNDIVLAQKKDYNLRLTYRKLGKNRGKIEEKTPKITKENRTHLSPHKRPARIKAKGKTRLYPI